MKADDLLSANLMDAFADVAYAETHSAPEEYASAAEHLEMAAAICRQRATTSPPEEIVITAGSAPGRINQS